MDQRTRHFKPHLLFTSDRHRKIDQTKTINKIHEILFDVATTKCIIVSTGQSVQSQTPSSSHTRRGLLKKYQSGRLGSNQIVLIDQQRWAVRAGPPLNFPLMTWTKARACMRAAGTYINGNWTTCTYHLNSSRFLLQLGVGVAVVAVVACTQLQLQLTVHCIWQNNIRLRCSMHSLGWWWAPSACFYCFDFFFLIWNSGEFASLYHLIENDWINGSRRHEILFQFSAY